MSETANPWKQVAYSFDCDEDDNCPVCGIDYGECGCPGPTMDDHDYTEIEGVLHARPTSQPPQAEGTPE